MYNPKVVNNPTLDESEQNKLPASAGSNSSIAKKRNIESIVRDEMNNTVKAMDAEEDPKASNPSLQKFRQSILSQTKEYPLPVPVINLTQNGQTIPFLSKKSFSLWQGKQKSKKTTVLALAVAAFIFNYSKNDLVHFAGAADGVILFFDNEQGESYAARTMRLILKLAGVDSSVKLIYCDLREFSPKERLEVIKAGIADTTNVQLVIIDGLVDLLDDFMDAKEGHLTTTDILKLCSLYDIHIAGVLHQNKADKNARAHIGSIASQKCEVEISTDVDPEDRNQSFVTCVNSRGIPFESFAIRWDKGSLPCINQEWNSIKSADKKTGKKYTEAKNIVELIFKPFASLSFTDAITAIMLETKLSKDTAKRYLKDYQGWCFVTKGEDGFYRLNST